MTASRRQPLAGRARAAALGGLVGPAAFIAAWAVGGATTDRPYDPLDDAISRLAAVGADTRPLMTAGFVAFGVALPAYGLALRAALPGRAWLAATATGLATLGVAATPLDRSDAVDLAHAVFALTGYATLAATPLLAQGSLRRRGHRLLADAGVVAGAISGAALALTATGAATGLFQRLGLTATDAWLIASALALATGHVGAPAAAHPR